MQQGDVYHFQTLNNGDIEIVGGLVTMDGGLATAVYLSLLGGNEDDDGSENNPQTYWGNYLTDDPAQRYVSRFQNLLKTLTPTSENLNKLQDAALDDLAWMLQPETRAASSITVAASIPALNTVSITVSIEAEGNSGDFTFAVNWGSFAA